MKYKRMTIEEREQIHALVNQGKSNREISIAVRRSHTTISKELRRCGTKFEYSPSKAHKQARGKDPLRGGSKIIDIRPEVFHEVLKQLYLKHSPERISKTLRKKNCDEPLKWISHESIYRYIYAFPRGELRKVFTDFLRSKRKLRQNRSKVRNRSRGPDNLNLQTSIE